MKFTEVEYLLALKVIASLNNPRCSYAYRVAMQEAPSDLARMYYLMGCVHGDEYSVIEKKISLYLQRAIEAENAFTLEEAKFLRAHNGHNPKWVYWTNIIEELEEKEGEE